MAPLTTVRGARLRTALFGALRGPRNAAPGFPTHPMQAWGAPSNKEAALGCATLERLNSTWCNKKRNIKSCQRHVRCGPHTHNE